MNKFKKKCIPLFLTVTMAIGSIGSVTAFGAVRDISGHWAERTINSWVSRGYINGYPDGTFKPNSPVSRAEFVVLVNKAFGVTGKKNINFNDISSSYWAYEEIRKGVNEGYIRGYEDGKFRPGSQVTRQEAAVMIAKVKELAQDTSGTSGYSDTWSIPSWSKGYVGAVSKAGIMYGYTDKSFNPSKGMTRAEAVTALDNAISGNKPDTDDNNVTNGNLTLTGSSLKDKTIKGNLYIPSSAKDEISLENVTVEGTVEVKGGTDLNLENCDFNKLTVQSKDLTIESDSDTNIKSLYFETNGRINGEGYQNVYIEDDDAETVIVDAEVEKISFDVPNTLKLYKNAKIDDIDVSADAKNATITFSNGAKVNSVMTLHEKIKITGSGTIVKMVVYESGVRSSIRPRSLERRNGASKPTYTNASGSSSSGGSSSSYDNLTIDKDNRNFDGDGDKYRNVYVEYDGAKIKDFTATEDLIIRRDVGNGTVTISDVDVKGNVYVYGGGPDSINFLNCKISGDIYSDVSNKDGDSDDKNDPVSLKFDSDSDINGTIRIQGNTRIEGYSGDDFTVDNVVIEKQIQYEILIDVDVTSLMVDERAYFVLDNINVNRISISSHADDSTFILRNTTINTIDAYGTASLSGKGSVNTITAERGVTVSGNVTVYNNTNNKVKVTGMKVTPEKQSIVGSGTVALTATVKPDNATDKTVTWKSSDEKVATVDAKGVVTSVGTGTATITATTTDGSKTSSCAITVTKPVLDKTAIQEAVSAAKAAKEGVVVAADSSEVNKGIKWVTSSVLETFNTAIDDAEKAMGSAFNQTDIDTALNTIKAATVSFNSAKQDGNKEIVKTVSVGVGVFRSDCSEVEFTVTTQNIADGQAVSIVEEEAGYLNISGIKVQNAAVANNTATLKMTISADTIRNQSYSFNVSVDGVESSTVSFTIPAAKIEVTGPSSVQNDRELTYTVQTTNIPDDVTIAVALSYDDNPYIEVLNNPIKVLEGKAEVKLKVKDSLLKADKSIDIHVYGIVGMSNIEDIITLKFEKVIIVKQTTTEDVISGVGGKVTYTVDAGEANVGEDIIVPSMPNGITVETTKIGADGMGTITFTVAPWVTPVNIQFGVTVSDVSNQNLMLTIKSK